MLDQRTEVADFYTSDLHFRHARINDLAGRPFVSPEEADEAMIERWNARVRPHHRVRVLGDACMGKIRESLALIPRLNGIKELRSGNHDRTSSLYHGKSEKKVEWRRLYEEAGFVILDEEATVTLPSGQRVVESHFPYRGDHVGEERYTEARPKDEGLWLFHGHVHEAWKVVPDQRMVNVGVDVWDFAPVALEELLKIVG